MINSDELLFIVDEHNNPIDTQPRKEAHEKGYWHRTSHVWVISSQRQILCQRRSLKKDSNPGMWEPFFGGHLAPGISYEQGAQEELQEEIGIPVNADLLKLYTVYKCDFAKEFIGVFTYSWDGRIENIHLEKDEIEEVKKLPARQVEDLILVNKDPLWTFIGYETELIEYLTQKRSSIVCIA